MTTEDTTTDPTDDASGDGTTRPPAGGQTDPQSELDGDRPRRDERRDERTREQLREMTAEVDALRVRLDGRDRMEVERVAAEVLHSGDDVWMFGDDLAPFRGEDGQIDPGRVRAHVEAATARRPYLRRPRPKGDQGARGGQPGSAKSWVDVFKA